jgi:uncharacterized protein YegL
MAKSKKVEKNETKSLHDFILLDRSGSMSTKWAEALSSINVYVSELSKKPETKETKVTVAVFDSQAGLQFDVVRSGVLVSDFAPISDKDATPRGMTPLYDAIVRTVALAEQGNPDNCCILIMTDGEENSSRETTQEIAKAALDRARGKKWQVIFLGADFDNMKQAASLGNDAGHTHSYNAMHSVGTMSVTATMRSRYAKGLADMTFTDEDRAKTKQ